MNVAPQPLPFLPSHHRKSGPDYAHVALVPEEKDGHIARAVALGLPSKSEISLKGAFAATSPLYLRREQCVSDTDYSAAMAED